MVMITEIKKKQFDCAADQGSTSNP